MADNYLEKKMEELRARRPISFTLPGNGQHTDEALLISANDFPRLSEEVTRLCKERHKVAFIFGDWRLGSRLAQATGARFYPSRSEKDTEEDLKRRWKMPVRIIRL